MRTDSTVLRAGRLRAAAAAILILLAGCQQYPEVTSRASLDFIKQVYTACNTRSLTRLADCEAELEALRAAGAIGAEEHTAFADILTLAREGQWQAAQDASLQFAEDQVR